jgi:hemolysin activation/secretion protein
LPPAAEEAPVAETAGARVRVARIELEGVSVLPRVEVEALLAGLVGQEATLADLRQAAARVTAFYRERGYFLARAYVPAQEIAAGTVRIAVLEGRYDRVTAGGSDRLAASAVDKTLVDHGVAAGQPVEQAALERSLILLEQKAGAPASALLQPGATIGTTHLQVDTPSGPLLTGSLGADNYGNRYTGQGRSTAPWASATAAISGLPIRPAPPPCSAHTRSRSGRTA